MKPKYAAFSALDPFFDVVQRGLSGLVDGEHYFDTIAKNAIFEFRYDIAGWPKRVEGRDALMALYRGYGESIVLHGGDGLVVHRCDDGRVIVIEDQVHGRVVGSGAAYENRFVSIVTVENLEKLCTGVTTWTHCQPCAPSPRKPDNVGGMPHQRPDSRNRGGTLS